jgi:hypothetical protein
MFSKVKSGTSGLGAGHTDRVCVIDRNEPNAENGHVAAHPPIKLQLSSRYENAELAGSGAFMLFDDYCSNAWYPQSTQLLNIII